MIFDMETLFSDGQAITASAGSTNVIDLGAMDVPFGSKEAPVRDIGKGTRLPLLVQVVEDFAALTSLSVSVETSDDPAFGSGVVEHANSGAVVLADLKAGYTFFPDIVPIADKAGMKRYMRLKYTKAGTDATAGKITAGIVAGIQSNG